jgi:hypothetical protein
MNKTIAVFILIIILMSVSLCKNKAEDKNHEFLKDKRFHLLDRGAKLKKCGSCHEQEFKNEMDGPHFAAYKYLEEHVDFINSEQYDCEFYTKNVKQSIEQCRGCHMPQNLHETILNGVDVDEKKLINLFNQRNPRPAVREKTSEFKFGIDCLSCHLNQNKIVSNKIDKNNNENIKAGDISIVKQNISCYTCHSELVKSLEPKIALKTNNNILCISCHQEYSQQGKGTHYYYWQHGNDNRKNPKTDKIMDDFSFVTHKNNIFEISWKNTTIPHKISSGPEIIIVFEINYDELMLEKDTFRINNKQEFDKVMYSVMDNNMHKGINGINVPNKGEKITHKIKIENSLFPNNLNIKILHKSQYWFPDSLASVISQKKISIPSNIK